MRAVGQVGDARDLAGLIDPVGGAVIAAESSDIREHIALPDEGVVCEVTRDIGEADDLTWLFRAFATPNVPPKVPRSVILPRLQRNAPTVGIPVVEFGVELVNENPAICPF